jgi:hypothetical protein
MTYSRLEQSLVDNYMDLSYPLPEPDPVAELLPEPMMTDEAPLQLAMGSRGYSPKSGRPEPTVLDVVKAPLFVGQQLGDLGAAAAKGAVQGFIGLPGDLEALTYGVKEAVMRGASDGVINAFVQGFQSGTILPTTEDVKKWLDENVGKLGDGEHPYETLGEFAAPGGYIKAVKGAARGAKAIASKATGKAGARKSAVPAGAQ